MMRKQLSVLSHQLVSSSTPTSVRLSRPISAPSTLSTSSKLHSSTEGQRSSTGTAHFTRAALDGLQKKATLPVTSEQWSTGYKVRWQHQLV